MSKEELKNSIDLHVAELMAAQLALRIQKDFQEQWSTVVEELAAARKSRDGLKQAVTSVNESLGELKSLLKEHSEELARNRELQRKAAELLDSALESLGAGE